MDRIILDRKLARRRFTLSANKLEECISLKEMTSICAEFKKLSVHHGELVVAQNKYFNALLESETRDEDLLEKESDSADEYESRWYYLEQLVCKVKQSEEQSVYGSVKLKKSGSGSSDGNGTTGNAKRYLRLPKLELPKFNGDIQRWLPFWAQFKKIHSDETIDKEDKFQYLIQSMEVGTCARELVESFPPSAENYPKVIEHLKQRFARDDLLTEHYVRQLLQLTLSQARGPTNFSLRSLYDMIMTQIMALESLGVTQEKYAAFLFPLVESALPTEILRAWSRSHLQGESGSQLTKLLNFVKLEVESEERIKLTRNKHSTGGHASFNSAGPSAACFSTASKSKSIKDNTQKEKEHQTEKVQTCIWCDRLSHTSSECNSASKMSLEDRRNFLKHKNACYICLKIGHMASKCRKHIKCIACGRRHYPIMCESLTSLSSKKEVSERTKDDQAVLSQVTSCTQTVLLQTLMVNIISGNKSMMVRALLDSAAQRSFIKKSVADQLKLKAIGHTEMNHTLFGGVVTQRKVHKLYDMVIANIDGRNQTKIQVFEQDIICGHLPKVKYGRDLLLKLQQKGIKLTDHINDVNEISLLIGSDFLGKFWIPMGRSEQIDDLLAMETKLGWTIQGPTNEVYHCSSNEQPVSAQFCTFDVEDLWKLESLGIRDDSEKKTQNSIEAEVLGFFEETVIVNDEGRYEVKFPWKGTVDSLSTNYDLAERRLKSTTKKLIKLDILADYNKVLEEWLDSDIIEVVPVDDISRGHYLPHHAVVKESSVTTKIRPVFDASAAGRNGLSLNDCLEKGSNLIEQIPRLLINFRKGAIGITADIKKAFLQISVTPDDREFLKFLWWNDIQNLDKGLITYRHRRVVFGVTTSPFLLSATILHHLNKYNSEVASVMKDSFYVDNLVVSVNSIEEMNQFNKDAKVLMNEGKFELRCWVSGPVLTKGEDNVISVLGVLWDPKKDELYCKMPVIPQNIDITKRFLLSLAQSIFDPLGLICPVTLIPKQIIQECWIRKINWDTTLPADLFERVSKWLRNIEYLKYCKLPRRLSINDIAKSNNSLHIFSDASQTAYSACVYLRSELNSVVSVQLVIAKSRVTPTKSITMPRLELIAALLGSRLVSEAKAALKLNDCKEYFWTDSSIVLAWIKKGVGLNVFVHNRVTEIARKTSVDNWCHVPGDMNPADLPSRGCDAKQLLATRWWEGPDWLKQSSIDWPVSNPTPNVDEVNRELKRSILTVHDNELFSDRLLYFSKYSKIVRTLSWCLRFIQNCKIDTKSRKRTDISGREYENAEKRLLALLQRENQDALNNFNLERVKNTDDLICVKTRLTLADDSNNFKCPILLPNKNVIVERLVWQRHLKLLHAGSQTLINNLREDYWIIGIRRLAKMTVRRCVTCRRHSAKPGDAPLPPLPLERINCGNAFEVTGVDLAGPLYLRTGEKCWVVLFTCATYRAVHLEFTLSLSTEDFLMALKRFVARRGNIKTIFSDNGTNFRGAKTVLDSVDWEEVVSRTSVNKFEWRFIPPQAPWWGGFWERMVGLLKNLLRRMLGKACLSLMEMHTVLCEVEAVINSRPITYASDNTENLKPLTPSMFIQNQVVTGENFTCLDSEKLTVRWRYIQKITNDLKVRFRNEYLSALVEKRNNNKCREINEGDIVLIGSDGIKRINWPLGLILKIFKGVDGLSRVARIRTASGEITRAIQRLYPLEVTTSNEQTVDMHTDVGPGQSTNSESQTCQRFSRAGRPIRIPHKLDL